MESQKDKVLPLSNSKIQLPDTAISPDNAEPATAKAHGMGIVIAIPPKKFTELELEWELRFFKK